jgi:hypothetical protein
LKATVKTPVLLKDEEKLKPPDEGSWSVFADSTADIIARLKNTASATRREISKRSGIANDPNCEDDHEYSLRLIGQAVYISIETVKIVKELPALGLPQ